jgi:hypothetical protein
MSDLKSSKKQKPYAGKIDISGLFELADENAPSADNSSAPKPLIRVEQIHRNLNKSDATSIPKKWSN